MIPATGPVRVSRSCERLDFRLAGIGRACDENGPDEEPGGARGIQASDLGELCGLTFPQIRLG